MTIVDRYVLKLYTKIFCVCFVSLTGLYIVVETFNNLEELLALSKSHGGLVSMLSDYFVARAFSFFDRTSHLLALMAAIFTIGWMQKNNEMTSINAAGVSQWRVIKPVVIASVIVSLIGVFNREVTIPNYRGQLVRNAQSWSGDEARPMQCRVDYENDFFYSGSKVIPSQRKILKPNIHLDKTYALWGSRVHAESAVFEAKNDQHPDGYLCIAVSKPRNLVELESLERDGRVLIMTPADHDWLEPDQCFVVSHVEFEQFVSGDQLLQFGTTIDLIKSIRNPSQDFGSSLRVTAHNRLLRPLLDISLLLIGLPVVISRRDRNIFFAAGMCVGVITAFLLTSLLCNGLGSYGMLPPYAAAWAPVAIFVPLAAVATGTLRQ